MIRTMKQKQQQQQVANKGKKFSNIFEIFFFLFVFPGKFSAAMFSQILANASKQNDIKNQIFFFFCGRKCTLIIIIKNLIILFFVIKQTTTNHVLAFWRMNPPPLSPKKRKNARAYVSFVLIYEGICNSVRKSNRIRNFFFYT